MRSTSCAGASFRLLFCLLLLAPSSAQNSPEHIVLQQDRTYCLSVPNNPQVGNVVSVTRCSDNAAGQKFLFDNRGSWTVHANPNLCIGLPVRIPTGGEQLVVKACTGNQNDFWYWNDSGDDEIQNQNSETQCVENQHSLTGSGSTPVAMARCNEQASQGWIFRYDPPPTPPSPGPPTVRPPSFSPPTRPPPGNWELIRLRARAPSGDQLCAAVGRGGVNRGTGLITAVCDSRDTYQQWRFQDGQTWRPRDNTNLCVEIDSLSSGEALFLGNRNCFSSNDYDKWYWNENGLREISPKRNTRLCVAEDLNAGATDLRVYTCSRLDPEEREWNIIEA